MVRATILTLIAMALLGCSEPRVIEKIQTKEVKVEVYRRREPPAELVRPYHPEELPKFVAPADPTATSGLTEDGERQLRLLIYDLLAREEAWRKWATQD